ncbi:DciA family protein [Agromyces sp. LY-1074]|nr:MULTISPECIES: DciA family protein [unclassified Agromyces]MDR5699299.1 DciA family protein [Agromyces sp. LY-1074]MDR5705595.1 DciA family protein [Agromyces sp. LY-1358]
MAEQSEPMRVYQHFREVFGADRPRVRSRRREPRPGSEPFTPGRDPRPLGDTIDVLSSELGWSGPLSQHDLLASWAEVAGEDTAEHSEPIAIEGGVLQVRCESTAWATQLRMMRSQLVARILERYPNAGVETIRFQGPDAPTWKWGPRSVPGRGPRDTYG